MHAMRFVDILLVEFDREAGLTRHVLERLPGDRLDWQPQPRSRTLGQLALVSGDSHTAAEHFRSALDLTQRLGALPWMGRALLGLAGALLRQPASPSVLKETLAVARQARAITQQLQMLPMLERADAVLAEASARAGAGGERSRWEA